jgi:PAS domain-containing protein
VAVEDGPGLNGAGNGRDVGNGFPASGSPAMTYRCLNDSDWTMLALSDGCPGVTGYRPDELMENRSVSYSAIIHPDDRLGVSLEVQSALAERRPFQLRYRVRRAGGEVVWVWEMGYGVYGERGGPLYLEGLIAAQAGPASAGAPAAKRSSEPSR